MGNRTLISREKQFLYCVANGKGLRLSIPYFEGGDSGYIHTVPVSETDRCRKCTGYTSVYTRNNALEQDCFASLLKVERSKQVFETIRVSLNTFIRAKIATEPRIGKRSFQIKKDRFDWLIYGHQSVNPWREAISILCGKWKKIYVCPSHALGQACLCSHCTG